MFLISISIWLMLKWKYNENGIDGWKMALEALLRCGGNMAIPGTDKMSRKNRQLAADMGLWITHHHAEPLGAEMFVRAYPDEKPNYLEHPELDKLNLEKSNKHNEPGHRMDLNSETPVLKGEFKSDNRTRRRTT